MEKGLQTEAQLENWPGKSPGEEIWKLLGSLAASVGDTAM